jgi:MFS family permease
MRGLPLTICMSFCLVVALLPLASFPALVPSFTAEWQLTNAEAGWISGIYYVGYMLAVPFIMSATDRRDARLIYLAGTLISALATFAYAGLVDGLWSALLWRALAGVGLAGTYMPGLKILTDRSGDRETSRAVAAYTACYSLGSGFSFLVAGWVAESRGWRGAFIAAALGPLLALGLTAALVRARAIAVRPRRGVLAGFGRALENRAVLGYILAYSSHNFEAMAMRSWVVSLLVFAAAGAAPESLPWSPTEIATATTLIGLPGTILGNELALRIGRHRAVTLIMLGSAAVAACVGLAADGPYWLLVVLVMLHGLSIPADAGALMAGTVSVAAPELQGASLALQASAGFGAAFLGPLMVGIVLDLAGGAFSGGAWRAAFLAIAAFACLGPLAIRLAAGGRR